MYVDNSSSLSIVAGDFQMATFDVTLSMDQTRDCVTFTVTDDAVLDPFEIFDVVLTTSSFFAIVYVNISSAVVTINDNDEREWEV